MGAFICCFLWGSAFPGIKLGYRALRITEADTATQILFGGLRFFLAGVMAILIGSVLQRRFLFPAQRQWGQVMKLSFFQTIGQYIFFYIGLAHTSGVRASIVEGTNVFVAILVAALVFRQEKLTFRKILGSVLGFAGVVIINLAGNTMGEGSFLSGDLLIFLSTVCYGTSSVLLKRYSVTTNPVLLSGYQFVWGGGVMAAVGLLMGGRITTWNEEGVWILLYLAFVSAVAYSLWGTLVKYNSISRVAVFGFMNPVFGVILSAWLLKEGSSFGFATVLSLLLICAGIFVVNRESNKQKGE